MATVRVSFDGGNAPIVRGAVPDDEQTPIADPTPTGFVTNQSFIVPEGTYCFGLITRERYAPLWQVVQAVDGDPTEISFRKL
jgi:hypothetical protein